MLVFNNTGFILALFTGVVITFADVDPCSVVVAADGVGSLRRFGIASLGLIPHLQP